MELWIGTSGYVYPEWKGVLYSRRASSSEMLRIYGARFPLVELNFSYYQMPGKEQLARMRARVPSTFLFTIKAHQSMTHAPDKSQLPVFAGSLQPLRESQQLAYVLCQFPQRFHHDATNLKWIATVQDSLDGAPMAVEFRHRSWDSSDVNAWLRERHIAIVSVDVPELSALYPRKLVHTTDQIYIRLHSRRACAWHGPGHERYDYAYSDDELREWTNRLATEAHVVKRALVVFNNCRHANAAINAERLKELVRSESRQFELVHPARDKSQASLFDETGTSDAHVHSI